MNNLLSVLLLSMPFLAFGQSSRTRIIQIKPQKTFQNYEHFKRLTLDSPDSEAEYIDGFDFEWGYEYELEVIEKKLEESLSDGTRYEYELKQIVSKKAVPGSSEFRLWLDGNLYYYLGEENSQTLLPVNDSTFVYMDEVEIEVPKTLLPEFNRIVSAEKSRVGNFRFLSSSRIRLLRF